MEHPVIVLIDDVRNFRDGRACHIARSSAAGLSLLMSLRQDRIHALWLDHDLGRDDTIWPVIRLLEDAALEGRPFAIDMVHIHASGSGPAHRMGISLRRCGYATQRALNIGPYSI